MKVLFVSGLMGNGGAERVISVLANGFVKLGYKASVVALMGGPCEYELDSRVAYLPNKTDFSGKAKRVKQRFVFLKECIHLEKPDLVVSFCTEINIYSIVALAGSKCPLVISERNDPKSDPPWKTTRVLRWLLYRFADGFVFQTESARDYFSSKIAKRSVVLPNPIKDGLPELFQGIRTKRIVTVARLHPQKNIPMLLESFSAFCNWHGDYVLEIFGDGPSKDELQDMVRSLGISDKVVFHGFEPEASKLIADASMFVLSSNYEGIPNALLEAMAMGLPVIATDCPVGGPRSFIENGINGFLVPVGDTVALCDAMLEIAKSRELANTISAKAYEVRKTLSSKNVCAQWLKALVSFAKEMN